MKPPLVILTLLIGAFVLGDLAALGYVDAKNQRWPDLAGLILLSTVFSQQTLVAAWFTFARVNVVIRVLIALAVVFWLALVAAVATDGSDSAAHWFGIQVLAFGFSAAPLWLAKLAGWQIELEGERRRSAGLPSRQFSIWGLLSGTTAVAIALGAARHIDMPLLAVGEAVAFFGSIAVVGLLVFFLSMSLPVPVLGALVTLPAVLILCPLGGILIGKTGLPPEEHPLRWALFGFCYGATLATASLALRIAGFRLILVPHATLDDQGTDESSRSAGSATTKQPAAAGEKPALLMPIKNGKSASCSASAPEPPGSFPSVSSRPDDTT